VCIIAVDTRSPWKDAEDTSFIELTQAFLSHLGDLLALHSFSFLISLVSLGDVAAVRPTEDANQLPSPEDSTTFSSLYSLEFELTTEQTLVKIGKFDLIQWRHAVARLEATPGSHSRAYEDFFEATTTAKDALPLLSKWLVYLFTPRIPPFESSSKSFQLLSTADTHGIATTIFQLQPHLNLANTPSNVEISGSLTSNRTSLDPYLQLDVAIKTGLMRSRLERVERDFRPSLDSFIKRIVDKLTKGASTYRKKVQLKLSLTVWLALESRRAFLPPPSLFRTQEHSLIKPIASTNSKGGAYEEYKVLVGENAFVTGLEEYHETDCPEAVDLEVVQKMPSSSLQRASVQGQSTKLVLGSMYYIFPQSKVLKSLEKDNSRSYKALWAHLMATQQILIVRSHWDLSRLETDGPQSRGLLEYWYAIEAVDQEELLAIPLVSSEQLVTCIPASSSLSYAQEGSDDTIESLLNLDLRLALENIPEKEYNPAESSSGLTQAVEQLVWASTPQTRFNYLR
jgi:hypothetical protein